MKKYYKLRCHQGFNRNSTAFYNLIKLIGRHFGNASKRNEMNTGLALIRNKLRGYNISNSEIRNLIQAKKFFWIDADINTVIKVYKISENSHLILKVIIEYMTKLNEILDDNEIENEFMHHINVGSPDSYWREMLISYLHEKLDKIKDARRGSSLRKVEYLINEINRLDKKC